MNIVLVIIDTLRHDHVGAYGNRWIKTPNLDALAKESLRFTRPHPESMPTICVRRAIHTGTRTFPFRHWNPTSEDRDFSWGWQPVPEDQITLADILKKQGYRTLFVTDTYHQFKPSYNFHQGFDIFQFIRGQESDRFRPNWLTSRKRLHGYLTGGLEMEKQRTLLKQYLSNTMGRRNEEDWFSPQVFAGAAGLLEAAKETQPFFLVADSFDVHEPWDPPRYYADIYAGDYRGREPITPTYGSVEYLSEDQLKRMRALYAGEITMVDRWLGHFLNKMDDLKLSENTMLIVISDHGMILGEYGVSGKPTSLIGPELTDILFMIRHPDGKLAGKTSDFFASTHDVAPTVLKAAGIEVPDQMEGEDLSVLFDGKEPPARDHFTVGYSNYVWVLDDNYAMRSKNDGSSPVLYDLRKDPEMKNDISSQKPEVAKHMFKDYVIPDAGGKPLPNY